MKRRQAHTALKTAAPTPYKASAYYSPTPSSSSQSRQTKSESDIQNAQYPFLNHITHRQSNEAINPSKISSFIKARKLIKFEHTIQARCIIPTQCQAKTSQYQQQQRSRPSKSRAPVEEFPLKRTNNQQTHRRNGQGKFQAISGIKIKIIHSCLLPFSQFSRLRSCSNRKLNLL